MQQKKGVSATKKGSQCNKKRESMQQKKGVSATKKGSQCNKKRESGGPYFGHFWG